MQAIILAAGMGKRLKDLTNDRTKCMVKVNGITLIERMLCQLDNLNLSKIIIVIGYHGNELKRHIKQLNIKTDIIFVENNVYYKTNNIYSLYLAKQYLLNENTLLFESDLIFDDAVISKINESPYPNLVLVAKYESWMDGTVVKIDKNNEIKSFLDKKNFNFQEIDQYYKTVNIYKFSKDFSNTYYVPFLEAYSKALGNNEYYEQVLKVITLLENSWIKAIQLEDEKWYEIDDIQDLDIAESIFTNSKNEKLQKIQSRYGGYWRYPKLIDFCYLVNPYYPPSKLIDEIKSNFNRLLTEYPSGMEVNSLLIAKYFGLKKKNVCVGNGAAEIIKSLLTNIDGKIGIILPTFEEYPNRIKESNKITFIPKNENFSYSSNDIINHFTREKINALILINPDNPSGNYIEKSEILKLLIWTKENDIQLIIDESFIDFAETGEEDTLLVEEVLNTFPNLIVIKSISKSYGVPGLRLGLAASSNTDWINFLKKDLSIWNINSFAEFYLQIFEKYKNQYWEAIEKFKIVRENFVSQLNTIKYLRPVPTQANYVLCEVKGSATELTENLLNDYNIFVKDLSQKKGFYNKQFIRVNVKTEEENNLLISALSKIKH